MDRETRGSGGCDSVSVRYLHTYWGEEGRNGAIAEHVDSCKREPAHTRHRSHRLHRSRVEYLINQQRRAQIATCLSTDKPRNANPITAQHSSSIFAVVCNRRSYMPNTFACFFLVVCREQGGASLDSVTL